MDTKSRADFINSVASRTDVSCPKCGAKNKADNKFCVSCGAEMAASRKVQDAPAFKPAKEAAPVKTVKYVEPNNVFAQGLPDWSVEPPQVVVRRR